MNAPIFIGGAPRSGTTLLRAMIDMHPHICCGPELRAIPALAHLSAQTRMAAAGVLEAQYGTSTDDLNAAFAEMISAFLAPIRRRAGKARVAEKTPANVLHFPELRRLFPKAPLISIVRDGRDVVASLLGMDWKAPDGARMEITTDPPAAARLWRASVEGADAMRGDPLFHEMRYEALVADPEGALRTLLEFLEEPWSDDVLRHTENPSLREGEEETSAEKAARPVTGSAVGRWRNALGPDALAAVMDEAGALLNRLGYAS